MSKQYLSNAYKNHSTLTWWDRWWQLRSYHRDTLLLKVRKVVTTGFQFCLFVSASLNYHSFYLYFYTILPSTLSIIIYSNFACNILILVIYLFYYTIATKSHVKNYTVPSYPFSHVAHCSCTHRMYGGSRDIWLRVGSLKPDCRDGYLGLINLMAVWLPSRVIFLVWVSLSLKGGY